ncbi:hypothetical protein FOA52_015073 [Chlamydomonas sp. UWO 241]|nr:hypothetical protein FOA52_015073 [Chlamydomonas sp. UWO 241]
MPSWNHNRVEPFSAADNFFGSPEINESITMRPPTKCAAGCLAMRVPDPPTYAPPTVCNISKDGKIVAVGGRDVELYLWDTSTGDLLSTLRGHEICWTTSYDNTFFVTVQEDSKVYIWDQQQVVQRQLLGHPDEPLVCCSVSLDDEFVVVGGGKGTVYSWDSESGVEYRQYEGGHTGPVQTVMCYAMEDGTHIIISCGASDHTIVVWDLETANMRAKILVNELEHSKNVRYHISKDGTQVLVWCTDSVPFPNLVFVDALNDAKNSVFCHDGLVRHAVFAKDSERIISCGSDGNIVIWDTITLEPHVTLRGHIGAVLCCAINEACTHIVSSGEDCTVRLWSAEDGRQLQSMEAQDRPVKSCVFDRSFNKILACDTAGHVYVWSTLAEVILNLLRRFADSISCVKMSAGQKLMAAGSNTGRVMMWDVERRELMWEHSIHVGRVESLAFNNLMEIASAGADGRISLMSAETGKQTNYFLGQDEPITCIAFSPDDERIAGCSADGKLLVYAANSPNHKTKLVLRSNLARVMDFVWSPNSKLIAGVCSDGCSLIWNATTGSIFTVLEGESAATCCTFDYVGKLLAIGTVMGTTNIFNLETTELLTELRTNASPVRSIMFNQDTTRLTTICSRQAIVWDVANAVKVRCFDFVVDKTGEFRSKPHQYRSTVAHDSTVLFDPESETVVYDMCAVEDQQTKSYFLSDTRLIQAGLGGGHKGVAVWSAAGNTMPDKFHTTHDAITACHFSHDDRLVVMGTQDGQIIVYDVVHSETIEVISAHHNGPCRCVKLSKSNDEILSSGADAKVIVWDWRARTPTRIYSGHFISVGCCDLAETGGRVVSGDNHGMISIWEKESGHVVQTLPLAHSKAVLSVTMVADGSTIASVGADGKVAIWSVELGMELVALTSAIESSPLFCAFSPDGNKLAITETNGNVMIWNALVGCQWYMIQPAHKGQATACSWSSDCRRLITCGDDSVMAMWDTESGAAMHKFDMKSGGLSCVSVSPLMQFVATGSSSGTLSVINVGLATRDVPEPSFLYNWLAAQDPKTALVQYVKLASRFPTLPNVQDCQGWNVVSHAMSKGNAAVSALVLNTMPDGCQSFGLISSIPYTQMTRVRFHNPDDGEGDDHEEMRGVLSALSYTAGAGTRSSPSKLLAGAIKSFRSDTGVAGSDGGSTRYHAGEGSLRDVVVQKSIKSFSTAVVKKVTVEMFTEQREANHMELIMNNALALALNSKSSECVQVLLDAAAAEKVTQGSYHAITDMMPSLAVRYPYMCYGFLANMSLQKVGELEVPVNVIRGIDQSVIRTAPYFTNVRELWRSYSEAQSETSAGPQPYAHVEARMVRLPFACALGKESLLQTIVASNVPVQAYSTPSIRAVIRHKWRLYGEARIVTRTVIYAIYALVFTIFAVIFARENHSLSLNEYWASGGTAKCQLVMSAYLLLQTAFFAYMEVSQLIGTGLLLYFRSFWNALDLWSIALNLVIPIMHFARAGAGAGGVLSPLIAVSCLTIYMKIFFYGLAFEWTAKLVYMVTEIMWACKTWIIMLCLAMVSFGTSLMVLYQYVDPTDGANYSTFAMTLLTVWELTIASQFNLLSQLETGSWAIVAIIIFSVFMAFTQLVLLNMLIALMYDIYRRVTECEEDVFLRGRAQLLVEVETLMTRKQMMEYSLMPPYVHLLKAVHREINRGATTDIRLGRLEMVIRDQGEAFAKMLMMPGMAGMGMGYGGMGPGGGGPGGMVLVTNPDGSQMWVPAGMQGGGGGLWGAASNAGSMPMPAPGMGAMVATSGDGGHGHGGGVDQVNIIQMHAQQLKESESQLPAILRQIDRLQRTVNNQEMRMEGVVTVLRDIENLLRNQQPVIITQEAQPKRGTAGLLSEAELEKEVKRLLGKDNGSTRL